jgi:hypothetical protein
MLKRHGDTNGLKHIQETTMYFASDLNTEDLNKLHEIARRDEERYSDRDLEKISIRFGAGSPYPSTPRSQRQYDGCQKD